VKAARPLPIISDIDVVPYKNKMDPRIAIDGLVDGNYVLIEDLYSSGLLILKELKTFLEKKYSDRSFNGQRDLRSVYQELSQRLLLFVRNNKLIVKKSPEIGWLKILYPDLNEFLLPFPQIQGLNSAWQWYEKGILIPILNRKIYPFFGTYFPTRFEHLELFDSWLKQYRGKKRSAFDIGVGSGILSFSLLNHGFKKVYGTDTNPNSIIGLSEFQKTKYSFPQMNLIYGDLFADIDIKADLIVFNPPWIPATHKLSGIDQAIYYDDELFPRFFAEAKKHLAPDGKIVLIFSNLAQISQATDKHPIEFELSSEERFEKEEFIQKKVGSASTKTKRDQNWRDKEMVELWVLKNQ
jgi:methylase of polypeptide subunit release factors